MFVCVFLLIWHVGKESLAWFGKRWCGMKVWENPKDQKGNFCGKLIKANECACNAILCFV